MNLKITSSVDSVIGAVADDIRNWSDYDIDCLLTILQKEKTRRAIRSKHREPV